MEANSPANSPVLSFDVAYQTAGGAANPDLRGEGKLMIHPDAPSYRFTGDARTAGGRPTAIEFGPDEIRNVLFGGRHVEFTTPAGAAGEKKQPFVFYCRSAEEAATVASLLPRTRDREFVTNHDFGRQLRQLPGAATAWTSVTNVVVGANVLAFAIMGLLGAGWLQPADMEPYVRYVANNGGATTDGEWWRILTSMFVHYGVIHLLFNMWALFQTGHFVERLFGRALFALGYLASGIIAGFTTIYWNGDKVWSAGASGAVFGVYGLLLGFILREKQSIPKSVLRPLFKSTIMFAGYNLVFGAMHPQIDNAAHLGGLLGGVLFGWLVALPIDRDARSRLTRGRLMLGTVVLAGVVALGIGFAPRFDYRFREELQWAGAVGTAIEREPRLIGELEQRLGRLQSGQPAEPLLQWIEAEMIPFYEAWLEQLAALELTAGTRTEERRRTLSALIESKLRNYRELAAGLRAQDPDAVPRYLEAEQQARNDAEPGQRREG